jgi:hypothetical protein
MQRLLRVPQVFRGRLQQQQQQQRQAALHQSQLVA